MTIYYNDPCYQCRNECKSAPGCGKKCVRGQFYQSNGKKLIPELYTTTTKPFKP